MVESIYFRDLNGYYLEIGCPVRGFLPLDAREAELTLAAAIEIEEQRGGVPGRAKDIETIWKRKGELVHAMIQEAA